jgi:hypothetical protein
LEGRVALGVGWRQIVAWEQKIENRNWKIRKRRAREKLTLSSQRALSTLRREETPFGRMAFPGVASVIARVCGVW